MLSVYRCPSDSAELETWDLEADYGTEGVEEPEDDKQFGEVLLQLALSNYVGVFGTRAIGDAPDEGDGPFFHNSHLNFRQFTDGLSNTFLVGERATWLGYST